MPVTVDEVRKIASLAHLRLSPEAERELVPQMEAIVRFAGEMELPGEDGAEPSAGASGSTEGASDAPAPSLDRALVLGNAPSHRDGHVLLPAIHTPEER